MIKWRSEIRYHGIHIASSRWFKCSLTMAKCSLYMRAANAVLGKIGERCVVTNS